MKTNIKKILKLTTLLITSLLIATVSAEVYRYMYIEGSITVGAPKLIWLKGEDADAVIIGATASISLNVENATAMNFTRALYLKNNSTSSETFNYKITVSQALQSSEFEIAKIHIYDNQSGSWNYRDTLDLTSSTDYSSNTLEQGVYLRFTIEVKAITNDITRNFKVQVEYWPAA
ncbi:MAG: hypothetical protein QXJ11_06670 [Candidatus Bathyarchaeia archaeon]